MKLTLASLLAACALAFAAPAAAQPQAWTAGSVHLRAGPAPDFPVVAVLAPRTPVTVFGCTTGYAWCDVAAGFDRGWVYARNLVSTYDEREAALPGIAALIGIGVAVFIVDDYWQDHYVDRWWYPQRRRWFHPPPPPPIRMHAPTPVLSPPLPHVRPAPAPRMQPPPAQPRPAPPRPAPPREPQRKPPHADRQH